MLPKLTKLGIFTIFFHKYWDQVIENPTLFSVPPLYTFLSPILFYLYHQTSLLFQPGAKTLDPVL